MGFPAEYLVTHGLNNTKFQSLIGIYGFSGLSKKC